MPPSRNWSGGHPRAVYADYEPIAFTAGQVLLEEQGAADRAAVIQEDLRAPAAILDHPATRRLDLDKPVCRDHAEVTGFFDGWDLLDPGVVFIPDWRPCAGSRRFRATTGLVRGRRTTGVARPRTALAELEGEQVRRGVEYQVDRAW